MTIDVIIFITVVITVLGLVLWDMNKDEENGPRQ